MGGLNSGEGRQRGEHELLGSGQAPLLDRLLLCSFERNSMGTVNVGHETAPPAGDKNRYVFELAMGKNQHGPLEIIEGETGVDEFAGGVEPMHPGETMVPEMKGVEPHADRENSCQTGSK